MHILIGHSYGLTHGSPPTPDDAGQAQPPGSVRRFHSPYEGNFEICNFVQHDGHYYGAIPKRDRVDLRRLGGGSKDDKVQDVTIVWVANRVVVGWYKNATIYAENRTPHPANPKINYRATCLVKDGRELLEVERTFDVVKAGARFGRSRRWYPQATIDRAFLDRLCAYLADA